MPADRVRYQFGEVVVTPVPYHSFRVGPISMETDVQPGETPDQALDRCRQHVRKQAERDYRDALAFWTREWKVDR